MHAMLTSTIVLLRVRNSRFGFLLDCLKEIIGLPNTCNIDHNEQLNASLVKRMMEFAPTPVGREWVSGMALELLDLRNSRLELEGFTNDETSDLLDFVCTS